MARFRPALNKFVEISKPQYPVDCSPLFKDMQRNAVDLAVRISHIATFVAAAHQLLLLASLSDGEFSLLFRKIIAITENAKITLENEGIVVYIFAACADRFLSCKAAYVDVLKMLQTRQHRADRTLQTRLRVLLMPLTSQFSVQSGHTSPNPHNFFFRDTKLDTFSSLKPLPEKHTGETPSTRYTQPHPNMLPPPNPCKKIEYSNPIPTPKNKASRLRLWDPEIELHQGLQRSRKRTRSRSPRVRPQQENVVPPPGGEPYRPARKTRKFGIYCTPNASMHSSTVPKGGETRERPTTVRSP